MQKEYPTDLVRTPIVAGDKYNGNDVVFSKNINNVTFTEIMSALGDTWLDMVNANAFENWDKNYLHNVRYAVTTEAEFNEWREKINKYLPNGNGNVFAYKSCGIPCVGYDDPRCIYSLNYFFEDVRRFYEGATVIN